MKIATSLILKLSGGMAAVGGAGGALILHKNGYFSRGSKGDKNVPRNQNVVTVRGADDPSNKDTANPTDDNLKNPPPLQLFEQDDLGLPAECETTRDCTLDKEKIKKVKFQALGNSNDPIEVKNLTDDDTISVTVEGDGDNRRYIFNNESNQITLSKGSATLQLPQGMTRFIDEKKKLKKLEVGKFGLPDFCETQKSCKLTSSDLETIKFSDFEDGGLLSTFEIEGLKNNETISLTIEDNKYIFDSPSSVDIKRTGSAGTTTTVELSQGETEFKVDNEKLKKLEPWEFGLPENCKFEDTEEPKTCVLTPRDLKKIKFKVFGNNPTVSVPDNTKNVDLKIEKVEDSSFPDKRKYIFTPQGSGSVTITGNNDQSLTLSSGENTFKKERDFDFLIAVPKRTPPTSDVKALDTKINGIGLPGTCTFTNKAEGANKSIECELSTDELKKLKFSGGNVSSLSGGQGEDSQFGDPKTYKLKIEESNESQFGSKNIRLTFLNKGENAWTITDLTVNFNEDSQSGEVLIIYGGSNTEFKINDKSNKLEKVWGETNLSEQVGLKCPKESGDISQDKCTLKDGAESIKVLIDGNEKDFKPKNKDDIENNMTYDSRQSEYSQGLKLEIKTSISGTNGDRGDAITLDKDTYEIKRIGDKGWRFTKWVSGFRS